MKLLLSRMAVAAALIIICFTFSRCNKSTILGNSLVPSVDNVHTFQTDTFSIQTHTAFFSDSMITSNDSISTLMALGRIADNPAFGKTTAIINTAISLPNAAYSFTGSSIQLDSVVLSLDLGGIYGDTVTQQKFDVYKINDPAFVAGNILYSFTQISHEPDMIGSATITPYLLEDSANVTGETEAPQLRIHLNNDFGNLLLNQKADGTFLSDSTFHEFLKGLAIVPDSSFGGNALLYFQLAGAESNLTIYYKNSTDDSLSAIFPVDPFTIESNNIIRNYNGSEVQEAVQKSGGISDSIIYIQDKPGTYANINIPYLKQFPQALINKAELTITQVPSDKDNIFNAPGQLLLTQYENDGTTQYLRDFSQYLISQSLSPSQGLLSFGGSKTDITDPATGKKLLQYKFNITRYLQHLISGDEVNDGFRLQIFDQYIGYNLYTLDQNIAYLFSGGQLKAGGGNNAAYKIKLHVIYTKVK